MKLLKWFTQADLEAFVFCVAAIRAARTVLVGSRDQCG